MNKEHLKSDYTYTYNKEEKTLHIIDLDQGGKSVTNNIENILIHIEEELEISLKDARIRYCDSEDDWSTVLWDGKDVTFQQY